MKWLAALVLCAGLAACKSVSVQELAGDSPLALEPKEWDGFWTMSGDRSGTVVVVATQSKDSALEAGWLEVKGDPPRIHFSRMKLLVRGTGDVIFFNMAEIAEMTFGQPPKLTEDGGFLFGVLKKSADRVELSFPNFGCVESLVSKGELSGTRTGDSILLKRFEPMLLTRTARSDCDVIHSEKLVFVRLPAKEETKQ